MRDEPGTGRSGPVDHQVSDKVRAKLNATVKCDFVDRPLMEVVEEFAKQSGLAFVPGPDLRGVRQNGGGMGGMGDSIPTVTLSLGAVPIYTAMLAVADTYGYWFVIRDYGVLVTGKHYAMTIDAPTIPRKTGVGSGAGFGGGGGMF